MQNTSFNHSVKVPKLYKCAAKISQEVAGGGGSIKQLVYEKKHFNTKALYALVVTTFQKAKEIDLLLKRTKLLEKEYRLDPWLAKILISEVLWGKKQLPKSDAKPIQTILAYEQSFHAHLSDSAGDTLAVKTESHKKPRYVRVNTLVNPFNEALELFQEEGWILQQLENQNDYESFLEKVSNLEGDFMLKDLHISDLLIFPGGTEFYNHPGYKKGAIVLQDKASCLPVHILSPPPGSIVLDMCAAPGMKTTQLATMLKNEGTVYAVERDQKRFEVLNKIVESSGATCIQTINKDVLQCGDSDFPGVEYILVDPSCSASGMADRVEIQKDQNHLRLQKLAGFQIKILRSALTRYPKVNRVVYSTCSIYPEENEDVVRQVLETNNQFKLVPADKFINKVWKNFGSSDFGDIGRYCLYARPEEDLTNGFFVAVFERLDEGENNQFFNDRVLNYRKNVEQKQARKERKFKEKVEGNNFEKYDSKIKKGGKLPNSFPKGEAIKVEGNLHRYETVQSRSEYEKDERKRNDHNILDENIEDEKIKSAKKEKKREHNEVEENEEKSSDVAAGELENEITNGSLKKSKKRKGGKLHNIAPNVEAIKTEDSIHKDQTVETTSDYLKINEKDKRKCNIQDESIADENNKSTKKNKKRKHIEVEENEEISNDVAAEGIKTKITNGPLNKSKKKKGEKLPNIAPNGEAIKVGDNIHGDETVETTSDYLNINEKNKQKHNNDNIQDENREDENYKSVKEQKNKKREHNEAKENEEKSNDDVAEKLENEITNESLKKSKKKKRKNKEETKILKQTDIEHIGLINFVVSGCVEKFSQTVTEENMNKSLSRSKRKSNINNENKEILNDVKNKGLKNSEESLTKSSKKKLKHIESVNLEQTNEETEIIPNDVTRQYIGNKNHHFVGERIDEPVKKIKAKKLKYANKDEKDNIIDESIKRSKKIKEKLTKAENLTHLKEDKLQNCDDSLPKDKKKRLKHSTVADQLNENY